jgi:hypothetical protein
VAAAGKLLQVAVSLTAIATLRMRIPDFQSSWAPEYALQQLMYRHFLQ